MISPTQFNPHHTGAGGTQKTASSEMNMDTFLRLLTVQLATQNPLEPMNDRDFFAQMAQLGTVQGLDRIRGSLETAQASAMIGKKITAVRPMTASGSGFTDLVEGVVKSVSVVNGEVRLRVQDTKGVLVEVELSHVQSVHAGD